MKQNKKLVFCLGKTWSLKIPSLFSVFVADGSMRLDGEERFVGVTYQRLLYCLALLAVGSSLVGIGSPSRSKSRTL